GTRPRLRGGQWADTAAVAGGTRSLRGGRWPSVRGDNCTRAHADPPPPAHRWYRSPGPRHPPARTGSPRRPSAGYRQSSPPPSAVVVPDAPHWRADWPDPTRPPEPAAAAPADPQQLPPVPACSGPSAQPATVTLRDILELRQLRIQNYRHTRVAGQRDETGAEVPDRLVGHQPAAGRFQGLAD